MSPTVWRYKLRAGVKFHDGTPLTADDVVLSFERATCARCWSSPANDEKICQALAAMWAQIGVEKRVNAMPRANYFPKPEKLDTSLYMLG